MKTVIQRVCKASVQVEQQIVGRIDNGFLILLGVQKGDTQQDVEKLMKKIPFLRVFEDEAGKMNRSLLDVGGGALVVSQFTLCADCSHGRRPSFAESAGPEEAKQLYELFVAALRQSGVGLVETGVFGAHMEVSLQNHGPVTILLDSKE